MPSNKILNTTDFSTIKLRSMLEDLSRRMKDTTALSENLGEALKTFKDFYNSLSMPQFSPVRFLENDTPRSKDYNTNLISIDQDIEILFDQIEKLSEAQLASFNYASLVNSQVVAMADLLASKVLDLKILSDFTRGDVIVAGDDFRTTENIDKGAATSVSKAEKMAGGGIGLKRRSNRRLVDDNTEIEIFPIAPVEEGKFSVNDEPTPGNLKRFYEGNYYNFIGNARPEGGRFNIKFLMRPKEDTEDAKRKKSPFSKKRGQKLDDSEKFSLRKAGYFVELGASEEEKKLGRLKMFDDDPSTFWEAEYVYHVPPLIDDLLDEAAIEEDNNDDKKGQKTNLARGASVTIDFKKAERQAQKYDFDGRDLIIDIVITFKKEETINYVVIDPVIFGYSSFIEVLDISTASEEKGQFLVVDGWDKTKFAKTITPEANEFLNDVQVGQLLAPDRFSYTGKGVFPFPSRLAKKVKIRLKVDNPVPSPYERYYTLLKRQIDIQSTIKTTVKKGLFR